MKTAMGIQLHSRFFQVCQIIFWIMILSGPLQSLSQPISDLYWSMEDVNGVDLYPTIGNRSVWKAQLNVSDFSQALFKNSTSNDSAEIVEGLKGNALLVDNFNMIVGIPFNTGCLFDLGQCGTTGLTVSMWMFVRRWTTKEAFVIATSNRGVNEPGISLYEDVQDDKSFKATAILLNGSTYEAAFNRDLVGQRWSHVAMTWSLQSGMKLFVNGSEVSTYTQGPLVETRNNVIQTVPHMRFGTNYSDVILDEIGVWYQELTEEDIFLISCPPNETETTTGIDDVNTTFTVANSTKASPNTTPIFTRIFNWRTETIVALSLGAAVAMIAFLVSVCVFCLLVGKKRRRKHWKKEEVHAIR